MSSTSPARGRSPFVTAALVVLAAACVAVVLLLQHHRRNPTAGPPPTEPSVSLNVPSSTNVTSSSPSPAGHPITPPAAYRPSALRQAEDVATRFVAAYRSSNWQHLEPMAQPNVAKPFITAAMYARMLARLPKPGEQDSGDDQYVKQLVAEQRVVYAKVTSIGIASGDGDGLSPTRIPLVAYFHTTTYTVSDSSGVRTADQPVHLTMALQGGKWLVSTADGI